MVSNENSGLQKATENIKYTKHLGKCLLCGFFFFVSFLKIHQESLLPKLSVRYFIRTYMINICEAQGESMNPYSSEISLCVFCKILTLILCGKLWLYTVTPTLMQK